MLLSAPPPAAGTRTRFAGLAGSSDALALAQLAQSGSPLVILAALSFFGGFVGIPEVLRFPNLLERYLAPVLHTGGGAVEAAAHGPWLEIGLMGVSFVIAAVALFFGGIFYSRYPEIPERFAENARLLYRLVFNKYFVDELYARVILTPYYALCR